MTIYLFVEGQDDKRFFEKIFAVKFNRAVKIIEYAQKKEEKIESFIRSINKMGCDYIFFADLDNSRCITEKKEALTKKIKCLDKGKIIVVIKEIESWYLAGLDDKSRKKLGIKIKQKKTDGITKEKFRKMVPKKYQRSLINFKIEVLNLFSIETATSKNSSLKYFVEKYQLEL